MSFQGVLFSCTLIRDNVAIYRSLTHTHTHTHGYSHTLYIAGKKILHYTYITPPSKWCKMNIHTHTHTYAYTDIRTHTHTHTQTIATHQPNDLNGAPSLDSLRSLTPTGFWRQGGDVLGFHFPGWFSLLTLSNCDIIVSSTTRGDYFCLIKV